MEKLLIEAAARGDTPKVQSLLKSDSKIDVRDESGTTALMEAAKYGHLGIVTLLLDSGADVNANGLLGSTALMRAAAQGHTGVVVRLLDRGAHVDATDEQGSTALIQASSWGHPDAVQTLLEHGADVNWRNVFGTSALMRAAKYRHINTVRILVNYGAEVDAQNVNGSTPLMRASSSGHSGIVQELLKAGAQVDLRDRDGGTALMRAAAQGQPEAVSILLAAGADSCAKDKDGNTPLSFAAMSGHADVVRSLVEWQCSHPAKDRMELQTDDYGDSPLILAARMGQLDVVQVLLEGLGGDLNSGRERDVLRRQLNRRNKKGDTALIEATRQGHFEIARILLDKGADPNTKNRKGQTAMMEAVVEGNCRLLDLLVEKGANASLTYAEGQTAFGLAKHKGFTDILLILEKSGCHADAHEIREPIAEWRLPSKGEEASIFPYSIVQPIEMEDDQAELDGSAEECGSRSKVMRATFSTARLASEHDSAILLLGESGSGKDFLAEYIHMHSTRAFGPFRSVNCAALPRELAESELFGHEKGAFTGATGQKRGVFELAEGGTVFLNEIGDMPLELQTKLLTFLDTHRFQRVGGEKEIKSDARIIAATNKDLKKEVVDKRFRLDLYHRLAVWPIRVPPLRERIEDIPPLTMTLLSDLFIKSGSTPPKVSGSALHKLCSHGWEGNVRELRNVLERALILSNGKAIESEHICLDKADETEHPQETTPSLPLSPSAGTTRKGLPKPDVVDLRAAYKRYVLIERWTRARLAEHLGVDSSTLKKWFKEAGLPAGSAGRPKKKPGS
jgi:DNA-binding NtrC family response regulator/ankyrin repeat protein